MQCHLPSAFNAVKHGTSPRPFLPPPSFFFLLDAVSVWRLQEEERRGILGFVKEYTSLLKAFHVGFNT